MFHVEHSLRFRSICQHNGLAIQDSQLELLGRYVTLLADWNAKVNLVSRADVQNIWLSHVLHSVTPLFFLDIPAGCNLIDLGSGGGFPGVPLAIFRPDIIVTHIDSIQKKTKALTDIVQRLGLGNSSVVTGRAEEIGRTPEFSHRCDGVVARAVAPLADLVKWSTPFLKKGEGKSGGISGGSSARRECRTPFLLALKGGDLESEIRQASLRQGRIGTTTVIDIVFSESHELGLTDKKIVLVEFA